MFLSQPSYPVLSLSVSQASFCLIFPLSQKKDLWCFVVKCWTVTSDHIEDTLHLTACHGRECFEQWLLPWCHCSTGMNTGTEQLLTIKASVCFFTRLLLPLFLWTTKCIYVNALEDFFFHLKAGTHIRTVVGLGLFQSGSVGVDR